MDLRGFYFEKVNIDWPKECNKSDKFDLKFLMIFSKRLGFDNGWEEYFRKCRSSFTQLFQFQLGQVNKEKQPFQKFLKALPQDSNSEKIKEIYISTQMENKQLVLVKFFYKVINEEKDPIRRRILILEFIKNQPNGLLKYLLELSVALDSDNQAWSKKIAKKIINMGPSEFLFSRSIDDPKVYNQIKESIKNLLKKIKLNLKDEMIKKMLINNLVNISSSNDLKDELSSWSADWTLSEIRTMLESPTYGTPFVGFWFVEMFSATYEAEVIRYLQDVLDKEAVEKYGASYPWLFNYYLPKKSEDQIVSIAEVLWKTGTPYQRNLVLGFLEKVELKKSLVKEIPELSKPLFQLKRSFFLNMLKNGENLNYSIYQLLKLGDRSEELLWWVALFEK